MWSYSDIQVKRESLWGTLAAKRTQRQLEIETPFSPYSKLPRPPHSPDAQGSQQAVALVSQCWSQSCRCQSYTAAHGNAGDVITGFQPVHGLVWRNIILSTDLRVCFCLYLAIFSDIIGSLWGTIYSSWPPPPPLRKLPPSPTSRLGKPPAGL